MSNFHQFGIKWNLWYTTDGVLLGCLVSGRVGCPKNSNLFRSGDWSADCLIEQLQLAEACQQSH